MNVNLDLSFLRDWQKEFFKNAKRFNVLVIHRRAGKTIVSVVFLIYKAVTTKGVYGYIAPTYKQAKLIAFEFLCNFASKIPGTEINKGELKVTLFNGSSIILFGADNPDSLRGLDLKGTIFDEYAQQPSNIYSEIVFPMINANNGWVLWIGTPKGKNIFYRLYKKAIEDEKFYVKYLTVDDTVLLEKEQLDLARKEMSEEEFNQEYYLSWSASIKGSYYGKLIEQAKREGRYRKGVFDSLLPVYSFWDLGMSDAMAIVFAQFVGNEIRIIDYYENNGHGFEHYRDLMYGKLEGYERFAKYDYRMHYFPFDIAVRELSTGLSRMETVQNLFGEDKCDIGEKLSIMDGINAGRRIFEKIWFDESNCEIFLDKLASYQAKIDEKNGTVGKPLHNEFSHCFVGETLINTEKGLRQIKEIKVGDYVITPKGKQKVINVYNNGIKEVVKTTFSNGIIIKSTKDHKFSVKGKGFIPLDTISYLDSINTLSYLSKNIGLNSIERLIDYINEKHIINRHTDVNYIEMFGNITTEKYQNDMMCIIKMKILQIMTYLILSGLKVENIKGYIGKKDLSVKNIKKGIINFLKKLDQGQKSGIEVKNEKNGIENIIKNLYEKGQNINSLALNVEKIMKALEQVKQSIVETTAKVNTEENLELIILQDLAGYVENDLKLTNIVGENTVKIVEIQEVKELVNVYDIEVENEHCYYVNGILVHNCGDAFRYLAVSYTKAIAPEYTEEIIDTDYDDYLF